MTEQDELSRMLREKVETFDVRSSDVPAIAGRAGRIRARRRVVAVSAVAVAVVAAAVPTTLALQGGDSSEGPLHPSPTGPSTSPSTSSPQLSTLAQIPQGRGPRIDWMSGGTVHLAGGRTLELPDGTWTGFAPYRGGVVVGSSNDIADEVAVVAADGSVVSRGAGSGPVLSADRSRVTWWSGTTDGGAFVSGPTSDSGAADTTVPVDAGRPRPVGYLGNELVYRVDSDTGGVAASCGTSCTVTLSGIRTVIAVDSERRLLAGYADATCPTKVFRVPDLSGSTSLTVPVTSSWPCVRETPQRFSPDGSKLALEHQGADGRFDGIRVRDSASGKLGLTYRAPLGAEPESTAWDDESHLLVEVYSAPYSEWTVLRIGLDGSVERAAPVVPGDDTANPFAFGVQP